MNGNANMNANNLSSQNIIEWRNKLGMDAGNSKADVDAGNLTSGNVTSWKNKLDIESDLSSKVDKTTTGSVRRVYGVNASNAQELTEIESTPTDGSTKLVDSNGIYDALATITTALSNKFTNHSQDAYNCNTCYNEGVYLIAMGPNCPSGSQYGSLFVMPYRKPTGNIKPDYCTQIYIPNGDDPTAPNSMFYRTSLANYWNAWQEVATMGGLNTKADKDASNLTNENVTSWSNKLNLNLKAPLSSPIFTGIPEAPTPSELKNDTRIATTAFVRTWTNKKTDLSAGNLSSQNIIEWRNKLGMDAGNTKADKDAGNLTMEDLDSWQNYLGYERVELVYDKDSAGATYNWGHTSGIKGNVTVNGKDFSKYKYLKIYCRIYQTNFVFYLDLQYLNPDISMYVGTGAGLSSTGARVYNRCSVNPFKTSFVNSTIGYVANNSSTYTAQNNNSDLFVYKIEGVY